MESKPVEHDWWDGGGGGGGVRKSNKFPMKKFHNQDSAMHRIQVCYLTIHSAHPQDPLLLVSA